MKNIKIVFLLSCSFFLLTACGKEKEVTKTTEFGDYTIEVHKTGEDMDEPSFELISSEAVIEAPILIAYNQEIACHDYIAQNLEQFITTKNPENIEVTIKDLTPKWLTSNTDFPDDNSIADIVTVEFRDVQTGHRQTLTLITKDTTPPAVTIENNEIIFYMQGYANRGECNYTAYPVYSCEDSVPSLVQCTSSTNPEKAYSEQNNGQYPIFAEEFFPDLNLADIVDGDTFDVVLTFQDRCKNSTEVPITVRFVDDLCPSEKAFLEKFPDLDKPITLE